MGKAYEIGEDNLVLDGQNIDVKNIEITVSADSAGKIERGQIIDRHTENDETTYVKHAVEGEANVIVAENVEYEAGTQTVVVPCYITGEFRASVVIATPELGDSDKEELRKSGIILA